MRTMRSLFAITAFGIVVGVLSFVVGVIYGVAPEMAFGLLGILSGGVLGFWLAVRELTDET